MEIKGGLLRKAAAILLIIFGAVAISLSIVSVSGLITYYTGMRYNHQRYVQGRKIDSVMRIWRRMLEVKHNLQYFLLRQKTPPVMKNTAKVATMIYK